MRALLETKIQSDWALVWFGLLAAFRPSDRVLQAYFRYGTISQQQRENATA